jgi:hypothetical protein
VRPGPLHAALATVLRDPSAFAPEYVREPLHIERRAIDRGIAERILRLPAHREAVGLRRAA